MSDQHRKVADDFPKNEREAENWVDTEKNQKHIAASRAAAMLKHGASIRPFLNKLGNFFAADNDISDIFINRPGEIFYEKGGVMYGEKMPELTLDWANRFGNTVASATQKEFGESSPILSAGLPNRERIQFVMPPACQPGTVAITIRKPSKKVIEIGEYEKQGFFEHIRPLSGTLSQVDQGLLTLREQNRIIEFIKLAIQSKKTIVVAGATGTGKTTFMKAMVHEIEAAERLITIEDTPELFITKQPNYVNLFYSSDDDVKSVVTPTKLLKSCLRMKPTRILLAELRGSETFDFINVASSGHPGTITSCHAENVNLTFERLRLMAIQGEMGQKIPFETIKKLLLMTVDIVIHVANDILIDEKGINLGLCRFITEIYFDPKRKMMESTI